MRILRELALSALQGVGDDALGHWDEEGVNTYHVRRRLTAAEQRFAGIDQVIDVRGTPDAERRIAAIRRYLPQAMQRVPDLALP